MKSIKNFFRYRFLVSELVKKGIRLKYRRSYLGMVWTLLEPILTTAVLTLVFGTLLNRGDRTFPVFILTGRLLYSFFSSSTQSAMRSIRANSGMIKKVYVPKYLYPLSSILYNYVIFLFSLVVLVGAAVILGVKPSIYLLEAPIPLIVMLFMSFGVSMILAPIAVFFRDMEYLWGVALMLIMYASAIFYPPDSILHSNHAWVLKYNPVYCLIANFRNAVLYGKPMDIPMFLYTVGFTVVTIVIGTYVFYRNQDKFILHI